jgi:hypothetical protein
MPHDLVRGSTLPDMTGAMQVFVYGLPRILLPRTRVNKAKGPEPREAPVPVVSCLWAAEISSR